ncbi:dihydrofolate reductase family protein [Brachybacterium saurashtrense]|uniref:DNA-binding protein n=1 Tax=Brachybacterium saurashtrense TaxID=556288 RepID=A0A345YJT9_9MICO|nr:dihydrofolate reductase family protein [Brachybacterium saurashtrense]AXK44191.1 DNA-binding protein [Brachybacterium saurashtrense]RRR21463.1 DNA-binding protein [Brachybacterium saurashtrense]
MTQRVRVQNVTVSRDGIGAGEEQTLQRPFGHVDPTELMAWAFATASFPGRTDGGGSRGLEDRLTRDFARGIGAEIMGRHKFGPQRGPWDADDDWIGWWGEEPPFHTPVVVLTHHERAPLSVGETTFHFVDATPEQALARALELADGRDVRIGGGVSTLRQFLDADLVDEMHVAIAPVEYGHGLRLWDRPEDLTDRFHLERVTAPSGVEHCFFWRR